MTERIADYGLLGDCHGAALVSRSGSVDWWCPPRFDARSVFSRILDPGAGHWSIRPALPYEVERRYLEGTMVLATTFRTEHGVLQLHDALALGPGERTHRIGFGSPHALVRVAEVVEGEVPVVVEFAPRPEYGLVQPFLVAAGGSVRTIGGPDAVFLTTERELELDGGTARASFTLRSGEGAAFTAQHAAGVDPPSPAALDARAALADTIDGWRSWSQLHTGYQGAYGEEVHRSAIVLQALTYQPTGAVVAAPTTSLPEEPGGSSNWDYRFAWLRDASFTVKALWIAACPDEAERYFAFMARASGAAAPGSRVQIMFGVEGERDLAEHVLDHLGGHGGSTPVRVGNDAWRQEQLDVMGEVLDSAYVLRDRMGTFDDVVRPFLCRLADEAADRWHRTDAGIWEGREGERHYLPSKLMCWVALDRAVLLAEHLQVGDDAVARWARARDDVRRAILEQGWSEQKGAYTGAFGSDHLDAGVLMMPLVGFVPGNDERMRRTIEVLEAELGDGALVRRWTGAGTEGAFVLCSYWLAHCHALAGDVDRATEVFDAVTAHANDLGLLAEEVEPGTGALLGNFPQALSHIGLIEAAWAIDQARQRPQDTD